MSALQHFTAQVLPGGRIEIDVPDLPEGQLVDVTVVPRPAAADFPFASLQEFFDSLPPGPRGARSWEELEQHFQEERNSWDR